METRPRTTLGTRRSRHESSGNARLQSEPSHLGHIDSRLDSRFPMMNDNSNHDPEPKSNGHVRRASKSIDILKDEDGLNEQSPLLRPRGSEEVEVLPPLSQVLSPGSSASWHADELPREDTKSSWYLLLLTSAILGLQIAWSVELSNGSPYLLALGISKSLLAFVWIAGPLSGTLVQPYVGIKSDRCRSRFGKRRPFMVGGAIATIISLMALAWTRELVGGVLYIFGIPWDSHATQTASVIFAVLMIYVLDFAINVIQAGIRAFIVDNAPTHQQDSANAWASRMSGVGNIIGYLFGYVELPQYFWFFGDTQFKDLCLLASVAMIATLAVSCVAIQERDPRLEGDPGKQNGGVLSLFKDLWHSTRRLPPQIRRVCQVQFAAWVGWFPFLFYTTTYIAEIYVEPYYEENPNMSREDVERTWERGTRIGTRALFVFAITNFVATVLLPFIVASSYRAPEPDPRTPMTPGALTPAIPVTPTTPGAASASGYFGYNHAHTDDKSLANNMFPKKLIARMFSRGRPSVEIRWLTLRRAWMLSHLLFTTLTWLTFFVRDTITATVLVALIGIPWAMTNWAPFALIAAEISKRDSIRRGLTRPPPTEDGQLLASGEDPSQGADQAGVVLGIHNVAIAAPQVIATLVSSVIFRFLQKPRGHAGDDSVAWVLRFGGCAALVAAFLTRRVHEESHN